MRMTGQQYRQQSFSLCEAPLGVGLISLSLSVLCVRTKLNAHTRTHFDGTH